MRETLELSLLMRDDFTEEAKRTLAARVNSCCSNPDCQAQTTGPQDDSAKAVNVGVAAHVTAASQGGPRYNPALTPEQRRHLDNGIWLCQNCAKLVDSDLLRFTETLLRAWKMVAEDRARNSLGKTVVERPAPNLGLFLKFERTKQDTYSRVTPVRLFALGLQNGTGCGTAKFPSIRYRRKCGLTVDAFGIDGCYGFGLPRSPSENEWESFRGGADHAVHSGETLKIAKLLQHGRNTGAVLSPVSMGIQRPNTCRWVFDDTTFCCEISAEGIPTIKIDQEIPGDSVDWPC